MDLFDSKAISPMLIGKSTKPFDDAAYVYELKLDGERAVVYLDPAGSTELRNKRDKRMLPCFPELGELHHQVKKRCILDGEYIVTVDGKPRFSEVQRRSLLTNPFKIQMASAKLPVTFVAFDLLYLEDKSVVTLPLAQRKSLLNKTVAEGGRLAVSRVIECEGKALYALAEAQGLEGIVAKRSDSRYYFGKRTTDWLKIKNLLDDDFIICGYIQKSNHMTSLILGQYQGKKLVYKGHVTLGVSSANFQKVKEIDTLQEPLMDVPKGHGNERAVWVAPALVCTVNFMERTKSGGMRQPSFKGLLTDKSPGECTE